MWATSLNIWALALVCGAFAAAAPARADRLLVAVAAKGLEGVTAALVKAAKGAAKSEKLTVQEADAQAWEVCPGAAANADRKAAPCDGNALKSVPASAVLFASAAGNAVHLALVLPDLNQAVRVTLARKKLRTNTQDFLLTSLQNRRRQVKLDFDPASVEVDEDVPASFGATRVVHRYISQLHFCGEIDAKRGHNPTGAFSIAWVVGRGGRVTEVDLNGLPQADASLRDCVERVAKRMRFGNPNGRETVDVEAKLGFSSTLPSL